MANMNCVQKKIPLSCSFQPSTSITYLKGLSLFLTLKKIFIKCMYSFRHDDSKGSSTEKASTQNSHQL